jgi:nucleoside phosphorylase
LDSREWNTGIMLGVPTGVPFEVSLDDCVAAARAVLRAEHGRRAYDAVRPRGVSGFIRSRGPLFLLLYVASREGRLVWRDRAGFALLVPPLVQANGQPGGGAWLALLRFVCHRWELLFWSVPPAIALTVAVSFLPVRALWPVTFVLALVTFLYASVLMAGGAVAALVWFYRTFGRRARRGEDAAGSRPAYHWTLQLCHCVDVAGADDLLRRISHRLHRLIEVRAASAAAVQGGHPRGVDIVETLVCLTRGVTTSAMREHLARTERVAWPYGPGADVALVVPPDRGAPTDRTASTAGFFFWYVCGASAVIAMCAWIVAHVESSACATACDGRPASYGEALRWLLGAADHLHAEAPGVWVIGWLSRIVLWLMVPVFVVAVRQKWRAATVEERTFADKVAAIMRRPLLLLFVVTDVEERAVLTVAEQVKPGLTVSLDHRREHTVLRLGEFSSCDVVLARSGAGPYSPRGLMLTADALIRDLRPDYVLLTGICFGLKDDEQRLGDVVIASQARDIDHRKLDEGTGAMVDQPRGDRTGPSATFYSRVVGGAAVWADDEVAVHIGPVVASGTLFDSPTRRSEVKAAHPDAVAGDMESHVFAAVAQLRKVEWCAVRGISDWGMHKNSEHQVRAAQNAARLVFAVICAGALANPVRSPGG